MVTGGALALGPWPPFHAELAVLTVVTAATAVTAVTAVQPQALAVLWAGGPPTRLRPRLLPAGRGRRGLASPSGAEDVREGGVRAPSGALRDTR